MKYNKTEWAMMLASIAAFLGLGVSIACMYIGNFVPGIVFWVCLILGIAFQIVLHCRCLALREKMDMKSKQHIGLISFGKNYYGLMGDVLFVGFLVAFILGELFHWDPVLRIVFLGITVFGFSLHCIANGRTFNALLHSERQKRRRSRVSEKITEGGTEE